ncbi:MAG: Holliday junction resolvase RuvX [Bacteroidales bacterium]|nr:Holliday junction resolvase RuvX [Bacteroidales bacterium]
MGRVLAIDYGQKRCGIAVTDILKISANGLPTQPTPKLLDFLKEYCASEDVECIIVGYPRTLSGEDSDSMRYIRPFMGRLRKAFPDKRIEMSDERFTSSIAHREMIAGGFTRSQRREKGRADEMAAVIILTDWLQAHC